MGKRRTKPQDTDEAEESDDSLGSLIKTYRLEWRTVFYAIFVVLFNVFATLFIFFFLFGVAFGGHGKVSNWAAYGLLALFIFCVVGLPVVIYRGQLISMRDAEVFLPRPLRFALFTAFFLAGIYRLFRNIPNLWRRLEVRQKGVRYVQLGFGKELRWQNVADIDVTRYDRILNPLHFQFESNSDETSPSLTKTDSGYTEFRVVISDHEGESIRLGRSFMCVVANPQKMIASLRKRADHST